MGSWKSGILNGWMGRWKSCVDILINKFMGGWVDEWVSRWLSGMNEWMNGGWVIT